MASAWRGALFSGFEVVVATAVLLLLAVKGCNVVCTYRIHTEQLIIKESLVSTYTYMLDCYQSVLSRAQDMASPTTCQRYRYNNNRQYNARSHFREAEKLSRELNIDR